MKGTAEIILLRLEGATLKRFALRHGIRWETEGMTYNQLSSQVYNLAQVSARSLGAVHSEYLDRVKKHSGEPVKFQLATRATDYPRFTAGVVLTSNRGSTGVDSLEEAKLFHEMLTQRLPELERAVLVEFPESW